MERRTRGTRREKEDECKDGKGMGRKRMKGEEGRRKENDEKRGGDLNVGKKEGRKEG